MLAGENGIGSIDVVNRAIAAQQLAGEDGLFAMSDAQINLAEAHFLESEASVHEGPAAGTDVVDNEDTLAIEVVLEFHRVFYLEARDGAGAPVANFLAMQVWPEVVNRPVPLSGALVREEEVLRLAVVTSMLDERRRVDEEYSV